MDKGFVQRAGLAAPVVAALLMAAGCAPAEGPAGTSASRPAPAAVLGGGQWDVTALNGTAVLPKVPINITFEDGRVYGAGSCNRFMGNYKSGETFTIEMSPIASTMMACPDPQMQQETTFLSILGDVTSYAVDSAGMLTLKTSDGRTITAKRAPA